jgi:integrase
VSVYKPAGKPFFLYDFKLKGRRFYGPTGQRTRRAAEAFEDRIRREIAEGKFGDAAQLTLDQAAGRWWREHGMTLPTAPSVEIRLERLIGLFPHDIRLAEITTAHVSAAMQARKLQGYTRRPASADPDAPKPKVYPPAPATVNRDVIGALRAILNRAEKHWDAKGLNAIRWADLKLKTPGPRTRHYSAAERTAWRAECGPTTGLFLECLLAYGPRLAEMFVPLEAFDPDPKRPTLAIRKRKKDVPLLLPLRADHAAEFRARLSRAREAGLETFWFLEIRDEQTGKVDLAEITYHGMVARLKSAAGRAGVKPGRLIHSARHHAGMTTLAATGNLRAAQQLLGHADIRSTTVYAHAAQDELRAMLEGLEVIPKGEAKDKERVRQK